MQVLAGGGYILVNRSIKPLIDLEAGNYER